MGARADSRTRLNAQVLKIYSSCAIIMFQLNCCMYFVMESSLRNQVEDGTGEYRLGATDAGSDVT